MGYLLIEGAVLNQFKQANESQEVRDAQGEVIGIFTPIGSRGVTRTDDEVFGRFDMERAKRTIETESGKGRPLADVLRGLDARESKG